MLNVHFIQYNITIVLYCFFLGVVCMEFSFPLIEDCHVGKTKKITWNALWWVPPSIIPACTAQHKQGTWSLWDTFTSQYYKHSMVHHIPGILPVLCKSIVHLYIGYKYPLIGSHQWKGKCWCKLFPPVDGNTTAFLILVLIPSFSFLAFEQPNFCAMQKVKPVFICKMLWKRAKICTA